jgi:hypothetical protein
MIIFLSFILIFLIITSYKIFKLNNNFSIEQLIILKEPILKAPNCTHAGLGDRIGEYILYSTLGKIFNCKVICYWSRDNPLFKLGSRPNDYPEDIGNYIQFPENIILVSKPEWKKSKYKKICPYRYNWNNYDTGDELVPEIQYIKLKLKNVISYNDYLNIYKSCAKQFKYKHQLPEIPYNYIGVHIRRGDKLNGFWDKKNNTHDENFYDNKLIEVFNKLKVDKYILCSESQNPIKNVNPIKLNLSKNEKVKTLEEFFMLTKATEIIQSSPGDNNYGGWTSYSYIASRVGDSILYSCSLPGTRLYKLQKTNNNNPLYNVIKYSDLINNK